MEGINASRGDGGAAKREEEPGGAVEGMVGLRW